MKKFNVNVTKNANLDFSKFENTEFQAKSEGNMWTILRQVRDSLTEMDVKNGVRAVVTEVDTNALFKDITFRMNAKGKIEMPNAVKETCRAAKKTATKKVKATKAEKVDPEAEVKALVQDLEKAE